MKKLNNLTPILLLILALLYTVFGMSQTDNRTGLMRQDNETRITGFAGPSLSISEIKNKPAFFKGGSGGIIVNRNFFAGAFAETHAGSHNTGRLSLTLGNRQTVTYSNLRTNFGFAGLMFGYIHQKTENFRLQAGMGIAIGSISLSENDYRLDFRENIINDGVFVIIPKAEAGFRLFPFIRTTLGLGYRIVRGTGRTTATSEGTINNSLNNKDFSGPLVSISIQMGNFNS
jgi:hypothetical protein